MRSLPPLGLYIHFPWCVRKCPYCDFNSFTLHGELAERDYIAALLRDLSQQVPALQGRAVRSIFLGGGTPSLFSHDAMARLLRGTAEFCELTADCEITLEANPGTVECGRFEGYRAAGINRVSLGAQSFDDRRLQVLGRIHRSADTHRAVAELHAAGLTNYNLDLMYGLPDQSVDDALTDLAAALSLRPAHLSYYQLTLEAGTVFAGRPPTGLPDTDLAGDIQSAGQQLLASAGFGRYEISAYALEGARCRHNLNYWQFGDYLGVGAGAHGKSTRRNGADLAICRTTRPREPRRYLAEVSAGNPPIEESVPATQLPFEFLLNALRLPEGFDAPLFEARTGQSLELIQAGLRAAESQGLIESGGGMWRASARGLDFLNDLLERFLTPISEKRKGVVGAV